MKNTNKILAIISARADSKRIPGKNIKKFLGKPLIYYTIKQALEVSFIDRVVVDTESNKFAEIVKSYGAEVSFLRPKRLAKDKTNVIESILYMLDRLKKEEWAMAELFYKHKKEMLSKLRSLGVKEK